VLRPQALHSCCGHLNQPARKIAEKNGEWFVTIFLTFRGIV
jgi:hypothetical protein